MLGFLGEYQHSLDAKGRVILPAEFREPLAEGAVLTRLPDDGCLAVYRQEEFEQLAQRVRESAREGAAQAWLARNWFSSARPFTPDKQGRMAIPQNLREFGGLERDVMVVGIDNRIELWDPPKWRERSAESLEVSGAELGKMFF